MNKRTGPTQMGQSILVVMDHVPGFLGALQAEISTFPDIANKSFTLLCCCPTRYWEHGGADDPEVIRDIDAVEDAREAQHRRIEHCLEQARTMLLNAGVPASHILSKTITEVDSLMTATMTEVRDHFYSGVMITGYHDDIVNRLRGGGLTDIFRRTPKVEVLIIDLETMIRV